MFGAYLYAFCDKDEARSLRIIGGLADKLDKNDFMFTNSPYSLSYRPPVGRELPVATSTSPLRDALRLSSPTDKASPVLRSKTTEGASTSADPGVEGIDEYGSNTFQIRTWFQDKHIPVKVPAEFLGEDVETDTEFENRRRSDAGQVAPSEPPQVRTAVVAVAPPQVQTTDVDVAPPQKKKREYKVREGFIDLTEDDDDEEGDIPTTSEATFVDIKPILGPDGEVKQEGDWWKMEEIKKEQKLKRKKLQEERDAEKDRQVAEAMKQAKEAADRIAHLESQMAMFAQNFTNFSQQSQGTAAPLSFSAPASVPVPDPMVVPLGLTRSGDDIMDRRPEDRSAQPLPAADDPVACTPASQLPGETPPGDSAAAIEDDVGQYLAASTPEDVGGHPRVDDASMESARPSNPGDSNVESLVPVPECGTSAEASVAVDLGPSPYEDALDFGENEEDPVENQPEEGEVRVQASEPMDEAPSQAGGSKQVLISNPYDFE